MANRTKVGIGLDVGSRRVQLAVLRSHRNSTTVTKIASKDLPHDAVVEGLVMDSQVVCQRIAELLKENHVKGKEVAIAVGGRRVMIKKITTDEMSDDELRTTISYEAKSNLPFDLREVSFDYARLPQEMETDRTDVLLVAAKNEIVFDAVETLRWAGGRPSLLEAEPFALQAALSEAGYLDEQSTVAALHIGFQSTEVSLFDGSQFASSRSLNVGGKSYVEGLIRDLGITFERAAGLLDKSSLTEEEQEAVGRAAVSVSEKLAEQVEHTFPECFGPGAEKPVMRVVLCGGGAYLPMLETTLRQRLGVEVEVANPLRSFQVGKTADPALVQSAPDFTAAVGLALRAMGDSHPGFNLLFAADRPEHKKTTYAGLGTIVPVVGFSVIVFALLMSHLSQENKLAALSDHLKNIRRETDLYRDKIGLVEQLTQKRADVAARIDVISELDRNRFVRIRIMQLLNNALPELTWITGVQETATPRGAGVNVSGLTSSNLKVSQFMSNLLQSNLVRGVDLLVSEQTVIAETNVTGFTLQVTIPSLGMAPPVEKKPENLIKRGAQAIRESREVQAQLQNQTKK
jgi:type IV pilus assembly protein PilM